ncbi:chemotaxis protein CheW [Geminocystis sp. NIES-3709]|uniref:chemotaxis protein CheW n=1 Tax=Geminocystis sp. NIES-3709 TaxID=1617448 RepID=UPI0005FC9182|nr:chemotaxis protein CheW [Geminocystis sp. NIES-3709]BAQ66043.1 positive regulator of CheA protein activity [Geminocystis sp. NIES-3709]
MGYYLTFTYNNLFYGVTAETVQEVFFLPELKPIPEAPKDVIGAVNVRGNITPIMDLNLRFGYEQIDYNLNDSIVILQWQELRLGILTNQIHEVKFIDEQTITNDLSYDHDSLEIPEEKFIKGFVQEEETLLLLLNVETLLRYREAQEFSLDLDFLDLVSPKETLTNSEQLEREKEEINTIKKTIFFPQATDYERKILQKRANNLRDSIQLKDFTGFKPISIFTLNQEYFGVELSLVQEFIKFNHITLIPCTPNFILGNINLRGEIITLIDIRGSFNLSKSSLKKENQAIIVNVEGVVVGLLVDTINDIFMLNPQELMSCDNLETEVNKHYLSGIIPYQEKMLGLIDLTEIILGGSLLIDEAV